MVFSDVVFTEKSDRSMLEWMSTLPLHTFERHHFESSERDSSPLKAAIRRVTARENQQEGEEQEDVNDDGDE